MTVKAATPASLAPSPPQFDRLKSFAWIFFILLSHWRHHRIQLITLLVGVSLATAMWSGVQAINSEARISYDKARRIINPPQFARVAFADKRPMELALFGQMRTAGIKVSPVLRGEFRLGRKRVTVIGIEPLSSPQWAGLQQEFAVSSSAEFDIDAFLSGQVALAHGQTLSEIPALSDLVAIEAQNAVPVGHVMVDISLAEKWLNQPGLISYFLANPKDENLSAKIASVDRELTITRQETALESEALTGSFHLNLTAFGFLSFAVGLFIVHSTISLTFEQRRSLLKPLCTFGATRWEITAAIGLELLLLALLAGTLGILMGYGIAAFLLPDVAATLRSIYGQSVAGELSFRPQWWVSGLLMTLFGTLVAAGDALRKIWTLTVIASANPRAWTMLSSRQLRYQAVMAICLLAVAALVYGLGSGLVAGFAFLGLVLIAAALLLPVVLNQLVGVGQRFAKSATAEWFWADTRQQLPGLSIALMALLLALAANIGVGTMVGSFRTTFVGWLDQRLASELYVTARSDEQARQMEVWFTDRVEAVLPIFNAPTQIESRKGSVYGVVDHQTYRDHWPLLSALPDVWDRLAQGKVVLVNEQIAIRLGLNAGDVVDIGGKLSLPIGGIYSDYGNPTPQAMLGMQSFLDTFPEAEKLRFGLRLPIEKVPELIRQLEQEFGLTSANYVEQRNIKRVSLSIFDRTFLVTGALNIFTLAVAGFAILTSLLTLSNIRLPQLAPVWAMGFTRRSLARLELVRSIMLTVLTFIVAIPVGLLLAWILLTIINVEAFGWSLPMQVFPRDWAVLLFFAIAASALAAFWPAWRLSRLPPAHLLKVFSSER